MNRMSLLSWLAVLNMSFGSPDFARTSASSPPPAPEVTDPLDDAATALDLGDAYLEKQQFTLAIEAYERGIERAKRIHSVESRTNSLSKLRKRLIAAHLAAYDADARPRRLLIAERVLREQSSSTVDDPDTTVLAGEIATRRRAATELNPDKAAASQDPAAPHPPAIHARRQLAWGAALTGAGAGLGVAFFCTLGLNAQAIAAHDGALKGSEEARNFTEITRATTALAVTSGILAAASLSSGIALLVISRRGSTPRKQTGYQFAPMSLPRGGGVAVRALFAP